MGSLLNVIAGGYDPSKVPLEQAQTEHLNQESLAGPLQRQGLGLQNQQMQRDMASQEAMRQAMISSGGDPNKLLTSAMQGGAQPKDIMGLQNQLMTMRQNMVKLDSESRANLQAKNTQLAGILEGIQNAPPEQKQAAWTNGVQQARKMGEEDPQSPFPDVYPGDDHVTIQRNGLLVQGGLLDEAGKRAEQASKVADTALKVAQRNESEAKLPGEQAEARITQQKAQLMQAFAANPQGFSDQIDKIIDPKSNPQMNAVFKADVQSGLSTGDMSRAQAAVAAASEYASRRAEALDPAIQANKIQVAKEEAQNRVIVNTQGLTGTSGEPSALAKSIANYQVPMTTALSRMPPQAREAIMAQVNQLNPEYQASNFDTFKSTEKAFTSGQPAAKANALNTMMGHLSTLNQAADALGNGDIQVLNKLANFLGAQTGSTPITTYQAIVHRLAPEVTSAYVTSGGTAGERGTNEGDFDPKLGPAQIKANIGVSAQLAESKIKALQDQYKRGTYGRGTQKLISDEAEASRERLAGQSPVSGGAMIRARDPQGKLHEAPAGTPLPAGWKQQ